MRVFLHQNAQQQYTSVNFAVAADGFRQMGWELIGYEDIRDVVSEITLEDIVVDYVLQSQYALHTLGIPPASPDTYPESLQPFLGRAVWASTINTIAADPARWPVFVKPREDSKKFTGVLVQTTRDLVGCGDAAYDTPIWCSEPVNFVSEWRCFLRYGTILDVRPYRGDWRQHFDYRVVESAVAAWVEQPRGCAIDFGLDDQGRTLVVETNDGFALGAYGLWPIDYAKLLSARWTELTGTRDWCNF